LTIDDLRLLIFDLEDFGIKNEEPRGETSGGRRGGAAVADAPLEGVALGFSIFDLQSPIFSLFRVTAGSVRGASPGRGRIRNGLRLEVTATWKILNFEFWMKKQVSRCQSSGL
jgi:hypothetical protein